MDVQAGERLLWVGAGAGVGLPLLARELGAQVTALEWDPQLSSKLDALVREEAMRGRVTVRQDGLDGLPQQGFELIWVDTLPPPHGLSQLVGQLRGLLAVNGRLGMTLPALVGLTRIEELVEYWESVVGLPMGRPGQLLSLVEKQGFEPLWTEDLGQDIVQPYLAELKQALQVQKPALQPNVQTWVDAVSRAQSHASGFTYAMLAARRREPNEKPPQARTQG
jgi:hypothetical protein